MTDPNENINPLITEERTSTYVDMPDTLIYSSGGLTKREYFAAKALQGLTANESWSQNIVEDDWDNYIKRLTTGAVEIADSLIEALNNQNENY